MRTFAVERISRIEVTMRSSRSQRLQRLGVRARRFGIAGPGRPEPARDRLRRQEGRLHPRAGLAREQSLEERPDGSVVLRLNVALGFE